jgi:hypothetical protein
MLIIQGISWTEVASSPLIGVISGTNAIPGAKGVDFSPRDMVLCKEFSKTLINFGFA